jgi:hypothetical protein
MFDYKRGYVMENHAIIYGDVALSEKHRGKHPKNPVVNIAIPPLISSSFCGKASVFRHAHA